MSIVKDILKDEKERILELISRNEKLMEDLPKGSISKKKRGSNLFCYLAYREGSNVKFKYLGKEKSIIVSEFREKIEKRKKIKQRIKELQKNLQEINRGLGEK
ncbi:MAG TPA: hypothetical protein ENL20_09195 [Candidatus Cloacimonetes bacterium]|nr:hypothetical protein [Candidatus Cloacimonadota bacterium]